MKYKRLRRRALETIGSVAAVVVIMIGVLVVAQIDARMVAKASNNAAASTKKESVVSLIKSGTSQWQYRDDSTPISDDEGLSWTQTDYDTTDWKVGVGSLGSLNGQLNDKVNHRKAANLPAHYTPEGTIIPVHYFRSEFDVDEIRENWMLKGELRFDDAVIVYVNGIEILSANVPEEGYAQTQGYGAETKVFNSQVSTFYFEDSTVLKKGKNSIAVELHQANKDSSDIYFDFIQLEYKEKSAISDTAEASSLLLEPGDSDDSVRVNWLTERKDNYTLQYANQNLQVGFTQYSSVAMAQSFDSEAGIYCYTATIHNMNAATPYSYRIRSEDFTSKEYSFTSAQKDGPFTFLFAGDPQIGANELESDSIAWENTLNVAKTLEPNASLIVAAGDLSDNSDTAIALEESLVLRRPQILKTIPLATTRGNHDGDLYTFQFNRLDSNDSENDSFMYQDTLFVKLNTNSKNFEAQQLYLKEAIEQKSPKWVVVLMHYSMFGSGPHVKEEKIINTREAYAAFFSEVNVDVVLSGHDHMYSRSFLMQGAASTGRDGGEKGAGETMYLTGNSSTGSKYYTNEIEQYDYLAQLIQEEEPYVSSVTIDENTLTIRTYRVRDGQLMDHCTLTK